MKFEIRPATLRDIAELPVIEISAAQLFRQSPYEELADFDPISEDRFKHHLERQAPLFVAEASLEDQLSGIEGETRPVGFAMADQLGNGLHLYELSVHAAFQRRGIGRALLAAVLAHAQTRQAEFVSLTTYRDIAWNAPFYESHGFRHVTHSDLPIQLRQILNAEILAGACEQTRCIMKLDCGWQRRSQA